MERDQQKRPTYKCKYTHQKDLQKRPTDNWKETYTRDPHINENRPWEGTYKRDHIYIKSDQPKRTIYNWKESYKRDPHIYKKRLITGAYWISLFKCEKRLIWRKKRDYRLSAHRQGMPNVWKRPMHMKRDLHKRPKHKWKETRQSDPPILFSHLRYAKCVKRDRWI